MFFFYISPNLCYKNNHKKRKGGKKEKEKKIQSGMVIYTWESEAGG